METIFSRERDCRELAKILLQELGSKISFDGVITSTPFGKYHMIPYNKYGNDYCAFKRDAVSFNYKFCDGEFLRLTIEEELIPLSEGLKLAVLSDFCQVLTTHFGMPSFFYTVKNDENHSLNIQWSFEHAKEDLDHLRNNTYFDDAEVDKLIEFKKPAMNQETLYAETFKLIGLPYELLDLVIINNDDFLDAKAERRIIKKKEGKNNGKKY